MSLQQWASNSWLRTHRMGRLYQGLQNEVLAWLRQNHPCTFRARVQFNADVPEPAFAVVLENESHQPLFATSTEAMGEDVGSFPAGSDVVFSPADLDKSLEFRIGLPENTYAKVVSDEGFVRRVSLDLTGRVKLPMAATAACWTS